MSPPPGVRGRGRWSLGIERTGRAAGDHLRTMKPAGGRVVLQPPLGTGTASPPGKKRGGETGV